MDLDARATIAAEPSAVFAALSDLGTYPSWLTIVAAAVPVPGADATWDVDLAGRIGPFTRTKRLRMARTHHDAEARAVRFERRESTGPTDNPWILTGDASSPGEVHVHLHYGGSLFPGADLLLRGDIARAGERLERYLSGRGR